MKGLRDVEAVVLSCPDADPEKTTLHWTHDLVPAGVAPVDDEGLLFADALFRDEHLGVSLRDEVVVRELHVSTRRHDD